MVLLNILIKYYHEINSNQFKAPIKAVAFMCPFFEFYIPKQIAALLSYYKIKHYCSPNYDKAFIFEQILSKDKMEDHVYHYVWDHKNKY